MRLCYTHTKGFRKHSLLSRVEMGHEVMKIEIDKKEFDSLIRKVKELNGAREIRLDDNIRLKFRYCTVMIDDIPLKEVVEFPVMSPGVNEKNVVSMVFDAEGLHNEYLTELEFVRDDNSYYLYVTPKRDKEVLEKFRNKLLSA